RETDPPAARLRGDARLEDPVANRELDAWAVVLDTQLDDVWLDHFARAERDPAAPSGERVERVLDHVLERPAEQNLAPLHVGQVRGHVHAQVHAGAEARQAALDVLLHVADHGFEGGALQLGLLTDQLEAVADALQAREIRLHARGDLPL